MDKKKVKFDLVLNKKLCLIYLSHSSPIFCYHNFYFLFNYIISSRWLNTKTECLVDTQPKFFWTKYFKKAVEIKPDDHIAWNNMGLAYNNKGEDGKALECYEKVVKIYSEDPDAWNNLEHINF